MRMPYFENAIFRLCAFFSSERKYNVFDSFFFFSNRMLINFSNYRKQTRLLKCHFYEVLGMLILFDGSVTSYTWFS